MRILIDECVDPRVKRLFADHTVSTVHEMGWTSLEDGDLLRAAQVEFDVLLTIDRHMEFQQNLAFLKIAGVVAQVPKNQLMHYAAMLAEIQSAIGRARPGLVIHAVRRNSS